MRIAIVFAFALATWALPVSPSHGAGGVQLIVIRPQRSGEWLVHEFIDNALVAEAGEGLAEGMLLVVPSVRASGAVSAPAGRAGPLVVFVSEHIYRLEERLGAVGRAGEAAELRSELRRQVLGGLFQVPLWPYLAASEVPLGIIEVERSYQLPHWREELFPATSYAGSGGVPAWEVIETTEEGVKVRMVDQAGEGGGIALEYLVEGELVGCAVRIVPEAAVAALYAVDAREWRLSETGAVLVRATELLGALEGPAPRSVETVQHTAAGIRDRDGDLRRYLVAPPADGGKDRMWWEATGDISPIEQSGPRLGLLAAILICWLAFGAVVVSANFLYRFMPCPPLRLLAMAVAVYPVYLALSVLIGGLWSLGFVPAAAAAARLLAPRGKRLGAFGAVLAASFLVALISSLMAV